MALNLGPDTTKIIGYEEYSEKLEEKDGILYIPDNKVGKRVMVKIDHSQKSCLYKMCSEFTEMRKPYKLGTSKEDKSRSDALKIMVNTFYGANANPYISYGDMGAGITITSVARWLLLSAVSIIQGRYGESSVVYVHTDGINCNVDIDDDWLVKRLRILMDHTFTSCESSHISMDKDYFKEGVWLQVGNYVLRNEDGSLTKHGSTFKATSRSKYYLKITEGRLNNTITQSFIDSIYDLKEYELSDFIMRKGMGRGKDEYKSQTDLILKLIEQGESIGMEPTEGTTFFYIKTKTGYKLETLVDSIDEIDMRYYWDTISGLLQKFDLSTWVKKRPPLTLLDKKQRDLMEWM
jgi:DNA polymerase elongation subunit (family B)